MMQFIYDGSIIALVETVPEAQRLWRKWYEKRPCLIYVEGQGCVWAAWPMERLNY